MRLSDANNTAMERRRRLNAKKIVRKLFGKDSVLIDCVDSMPMTSDDMLRGERGQDTGTVEYSKPAVYGYRSGDWCRCSPLGINILRSLNGIRE